MPDAMAPYPIGVDWTATSIAAEFIDYLKPRTIVIRGLETTDRRIARRYSRQFGTRFTIDRALKPKRYLLFSQVKMAVAVHHA